MTAVAIDTLGVTRKLAAAGMPTPAQVEQYRGGKDKLFGFFVGQVMKASKGQANPDQVNGLLRAKLAG